MIQLRPLRRLIRWLIGAMALTAVLGANCLPFFPSAPVSTHPDTVVIEMLNYTDYPIEPRLFVNPDPDIPTYGDLIQDENWLLVDPPLQPDELATFEFYCEDVGTMASDYAELLLSDTEYVESDNGPWLFSDFDYQCGDDVSFLFIDDGQVFFTRVEVNGEFLTDTD